MARPSWKVPHRACLTIPHRTKPPIRPRTIGISIEVREFYISDLKASLFRSGKNVGAFGDAQGGQKGEFKS